VADANEIAPLIRDLCAADPAKRTLAATEIFRHGSAMVQSAMQEWLVHPPMVRLLVRGPSGALEITAGIAVKPDTFKEIRSANDSPRLADVPPDQDAMEFELDFPGGVRLDILTTREPSGVGAIARYLLKFDEGIQQVEIKVTDVDAATTILRNQFALAPVYPATRAGADGTRINFFLVPKFDVGKVLIELVELVKKM
jgi:hypothetical protein